jgi:uncharacterized protein YpmB
MKLAERQYLTRFFVVIIITIIIIIIIIGLLICLCFWEGCNEQERSES